MDVYQLVIVSQEQLKALMGQDGLWSSETVSQVSAMFVRLFVYIDESVKLTYYVNLIVF